MKFFCTDCDLEKDNHRDLPYDTYVVQYIDEGVTKFDIVQPRKQIDIFDYYWDNYREGLQQWWQSEGRVNPKLWQTGNKTSKKK